MARQTATRRLRHALAGTAALLALAPAAATADPVGEPVEAGFFLDHDTTWDERSARFLAAGTSDTCEATLRFFDGTGPLSEPAPFPGGDLPNYDICGPVGVAADPASGRRVVVYAQGGVRAVLVGPGEEVGAPVALSARGEAPAVAWDPRLGQYFVAWQEAGVIRGKRLAADGTPVGSGVSRVSDRTSANAAPRVAARPGLGWIVTWQSGSAAASDVIAQAVAPSGSDTGPDDVRVSTHRNLPGLVQNVEPAVAYHPGRDEALVVFSDGYEIFGQRLSRSLGRVGGTGRLSRMGPDGSTDYRARRPAVAFHPRAGEYLVTWIGNDLDPASAGEEEAFAQHVSATGAQRGTDDAPLSAEPEGDLYGSTDVEADPRGREYAATWSDCCSEGETDGLTARRVVAP